MKYNQYYNKEVMNLKQLTCDLEKQGYTCGLSGNISSIYKLGSNKVAQKLLDRCIKIAQHSLGYHILYLHGNRTSMNLYLCNVC